MRRNLSTSHIRIVLEIMHELNMVQQFEIPQPGVGRRGVLWRATKNIVSKDFNNLLLERLNSLPKPAPVDVSVGLENIDSVASTLTDTTDPINHMPDA